MRRFKVLQSRLTTGGSWYLRFSKHSQTTGQHSRRVHNNVCPPTHASSRHLEPRSCGLGQSRRAPDNLVRCERVSSDLSFFNSPEGHSAPLCSRVQTTGWTREKNEIAERCGPFAPAPQRLGLVALFALHLSFSPQTARGSHFLATPANINVGKSLYVHMCAIYGPRSGEVGPPLPLRLAEQARGSVTRREWPRAALYHINPPRSLSSCMSVWLPGEILPDDGCSGAVAPWPPYGFNQPQSRFWRNSANPWHSRSVLQ